MEKLVLRLREAGFRLAEEHVGPIEELAAGPGAKFPVFCVALPRRSGQARGEDEEISIAGAISAYAHRRAAEWRAASANDRRAAGEPAVIRAAPHDGNWGCIRKIAFYHAGGDAAPLRREREALLAIIKNLSAHKT
ncbi:MAG: hypothetical protein V1787_05685 [Candidatus Micrarchaeota archaeon]